MCGIVGVMTEKLLMTDYLRFKDLMVLAQLRGEEGAGMVAVPKKATVEKVNMRRTIWSSGHLVTTQDFHDCIKGDNNILIGHARAPTKGGTKLAAVHPHKSNHIVMVHNGTMFSVAGKSVAVTESDSALICKALAEKGIEEVIKTSSGAMCLVWIDLQKQTMNFYRNDQRPLTLAAQHYGDVKATSRSHIWFASEGWMISMALGRYTGYKADNFQYMSLPINEHWEFPLKLEYNIKDPIRTKIEKPPVYNYGGNYLGGYGDWDGHWDSYDGYGTATKETTAPFDGGTSAKSNVSSISSNADTTRRPVGNPPALVYFPPEGREAKRTPIIKASDVLARSKFDAEAASSAVKRKEATKDQSALFPAANQSPLDVATSLADFEAKQERTLDLIGRGPCVWCDTKPVLIHGHTPRVYPVRFHESRHEYVCSSCIADKDVQRMVGIS